MTSRYPVYILSKGRYDNCLTAKFMTDDGLDFYLVVENQEYPMYLAKFPNANILILPPENSGKGAIYVRNWIWEHSQRNGFERHWEFDDNISAIRMLNRGKRIPCNSKLAIGCVEEFTDRYTNIAISGFNYTMFVTDDTQLPYYLNCHLYSGMLIKNDLPFRWRLRYNADTDLCLQVLVNNYCTVSFNQFSIVKVATMTMKGGNTDRYKGNGRLIMAKVLEEMWPKYVKTKLRFGRAQHVINWKQHFKQKLIRRKDINWIEIGLKKFKINLVAKGTIKSKVLQKMQKSYNAEKRS